ncbi:Muramidase-2 [Microbacterium oxydans]|uniref:LysM peptidoglycan-binding domain-containing protein n=1 Tax=Microbacterium oxydans TaxID=82380 RepID=UPI001DAC105D|nr:LysM peptidoglycan-binding domain-containing protein [Microbacterium oxydans]CAH0167199.1 Muramidase-2 [Microbacterium oxydans]
MRLDTAARRTRYLHLGVPAAVLGALAGTMAAGPAAADTAASTQPIERLSGASRVVPLQTAPASYVVQAGDTIATIAGRFGLRTVDVLTWNGLSWRSVIYPGQTITLQAPAAALPVAAPAPAAQTHTVVAGDSVFAIARKYGTSVDAVLTANGLTRASVIYPGQQLAVGGNAPQAAPAAAAAPVAQATPPAAGSHAVVAGDTVSAIAKKYGTTTQAIFSLNGLDASSIIYPGQTLIVGQAPAPAAAPAAVAPNGQLQATLTAEQAANAALIIRIGRELGVSDRGVAIALATAMVESGMRNLDWGDRDSLGIFQQRPSTGWGAPEQILDADRSTRVFYGGQSDPNGSATRGLLDIPGWESMAFTDAAQAVQISAFPQRYGQWETQSYAWLAQHG